MSITSALPGKELFEQTAIELAIDPSMVEKDWHVTRLLAFFSRMHIPGFQVVFSGGTALSKAHGLIQRFSEDVDFRVIAPGNPTRQNLSDFKNKVVEALRQSGYRVGEPTARDGNRYFSFDIDYRTLFDPNDALRPHIKVEFKVVSPQIAAVQKPIQSLVNQLAQRPPEVAGIACATPIESAADKISALAWRIPSRVRGEKYDDPAIVRHVYDLAMLESVVSADEQFPRLALASLQLDKDTLLKGKPLSALSNKEKFAQMVDILLNDAEYRREYGKFVRGLSYAQTGQDPSFETAMESVKRLAGIVLMAEGQKS